eukprot:scaffold107004_cov33-Tisochrysis_lutea.AAC.5
MHPPDASTGNSEQTCTRADASRPMRAVRPSIRRDWAQIPPLLTDEDIWVAPRYVPGGVAQLNRREPPRLNTSRESDELLATLRAPRNSPYGVQSSGGGGEGTHPSLAIPFGEFGSNCFKRLLTERRKVEQAAGALKCLLAWCACVHPVLALQLLSSETARSAHTEIVEQLPLCRLCEATYLVYFVAERPER